MSKENINVEKSINLDNINILSIDEMIVLRKRYRKELDTYASESREYYVTCCKMNLLRDMINKKMGLFNKQQLDEIREKRKEESTISISDNMINKEIDRSSELDLKIDEEKIKLRDIVRNTTISSAIEHQEKHLNVDKILSLEDVKRVLKFMNIKAVDDGVLQSQGFEEVRDLFE